MRLHRSELLLVIAVLLVPGSAFALSGDSVVLASDTLVDQTEITQGGGSVLMSKTVSIPSSTRVLVCTTFRWLAEYPQYTSGDRVAYIRIDGSDVGTLLVTDSGPSNLWQFSNGGCYSATLSSGNHTFAVHFGGCCGDQVNDRFTVGAGSRMDIVW